MTKLGRIKQPRYPARSFRVIPRRLWCLRTAVKARIECRRKARTKRGDRIILVELFIERCRKKARASLAEKISPEEKYTRARGRDRKRGRKRKSTFPRETRIQFQTKLWLIQPSDLRKYFRIETRGPLRNLEGSSPAG